MCAVTPWPITERDGVAVDEPPRSARIVANRARSARVRHALRVPELWNANASAWTELSRAGFDVYRDLVNTPALWRRRP